MQVVGVDLFVAQKHVPKLTDISSFDKIVNEVRFLYFYERHKTAY